VSVVDVRVDENHQTFLEGGTEIARVLRLACYGSFTKGKGRSCTFPLPQGLLFAAEIFGFFCASNISICIVVPGIRFTSHLFDNPYNEEVII
jgi:hypothetical protein